MDKVIIRFATPSDAAALLDIYSPYILNTAITFETIVPTVEDFAERIRNIFLVIPILWPL